MLVDDVKAELPRPEASRSKKSKAAVRASSVVLKPTPPGKAPKASQPSAEARRAPSPLPAARAKSSAATKAASPAKRAPSAKNGASSKSEPTRAPVRGKASARVNGASSSKATTSTILPPPKRPARKSIKEAAGVSTDAVARRTGKTWDDWFEVLDTAGAATLDQRGIIAILAQKHGIGPWWQQMIAVGYESLRAKSDKPAAPEGFLINSSCTLAAPVARVFRLWSDAGERGRWLADERFVVRSTTTGKVIRARWGKGASHIAVSFTEVAGRTEVKLEHHQIESRAAADQMKAYWEKKLGLLDGALSNRG